SSTGTSNLLRTAQQCDAERRIVPTRLPTAYEHSPAAHFAIIVMRTATSHRPFSFFNDKYYKMGVEFLRPGTILPSRSTVSRDLKLLYVELSRNVKSYLWYCVSWSGVHADTKTLEPEPSLPRSY
ncbi:hypothetical protein DFH09DRAFT_941304, partial [Mycena vulgaris]